jgi:hypothetical protein
MINHLAITTSLSLAARGLVRKADLTLFRMYNRILARNSNLVFRSILKTPPLATDGASDTVVFTVLDRRNYRAYLLAAKSFLRYCAPKERPRVVVQSDGTLNQQCARDLQTHLPGLEILEPGESRRIIAERASPQLLKLLPPLEQCHFFLVYKLLSVIYRFPGKKVILFDSDLLFLREPIFVKEWIRNGQERCFHSDGGNGLTSAFRSMGFDFSRVSIDCFNAGFIGFHNRVEERSLVEVISRIRKHDESLLANWEIEQAIWAVLFNQMPGPANLDDVQKNYVASGYWTLERMNQSVVVHFIGSARFKNLRYLRLAHRVISELSQPHRAGVPHQS